VVVEMHVDIVNINYCVRSEVRNKVPEIPYVALLKLKAPVRTISVESTFALNPWCFGATTHILPSAKPSIIHGVFSPNWKNT
jgi:hypothetical protein